MLAGVCPKEPVAPCRLCHRSRKVLGMIEELRASGVTQAVPRRLWQEPVLHLKGARRLQARACGPGRPSLHPPDAVSRRRCCFCPASSMPPRGPRPAAMSTSSLRRQVNIVHNYSEAEIKVREATSKPLGPVQLAHVRDRRPHLQRNSPSRIMEA